jgi:hypothetical protein
LVAALENYRQSVAIVEQLAAGEPANSSWQRELALGHGRIAMLLVRQGSQREAAAALKQGHAILQRLRQLAPNDAVLPKDVVWFEERLAALKK